MIFRVVLGVFLASLGIALLANIFGYSVLAKYIGVPALVMSGWAVLGHLVTLDDDAPGEWSNPDGEKSIWRHSLVELGLKVTVFTVVGIAIYA